MSQIIPGAGCQCVRPRKIIEIGNALQGYALVRCSTPDVAVVITVVAVVVGSGGLENDQIPDDIGNPQELIVADIVVVAACALKINQRDLVTWCEAPRAGV